MLVKDLIKELQNLPQEIDVCFLDDSYKLESINNINIYNKNDRWEYRKSGKIIEGKVVELC